MTRKNEFSCGICSAVRQAKGATNCFSADPDNRPPRPAYCPVNEHGGLIRECFDLYKEDSDDARMARNAAKVEGLCYQREPGSQTAIARLTRVEEVIVFAKLMGYKKIGIATCIGLLDETNKLSAILRAQDFTPLSVCCKTGSIDKLELGLKESEKVRPSCFEPACNPIAQARLMNLAGTDMNIIVGLCVGHDMLFIKHSDAPVTTVVVKDRVTGHNPVSVLYGQNYYYKRLQLQKVAVGEGQAPQ